MGAERSCPGNPPDYFKGIDSFGCASPAHRVYLDAFCIDKHEVTVERYEACVLAGVCEPSRQRDGPGVQPPVELGAFETQVNHYPPQCADRGERCPHYPVNCRTWEQAATYCNWIGRRLCTEAEWERAASGPGPSKRVHPWGDQPVTKLRANTSLDGPGFLEPVDSHPTGASSEGVLNLVGNVYEWVQDWYSPYPVPSAQPLRNPLGPEHGSLRVGRGGCFLTDSNYNATERTTFSSSFDWG